MTVDGGPVGGVLTCAEDGVATKLRCRECQAAICPACFVRTPVGLRCRACAAATVPVVTSFRERRRWPVVAAAVTVVALALAGGAWAAGRGGSSADDSVEGAQPALRKVDPLTVATGDFANGTSWTLVARRDGTICFTLTVSTGDPAPERCQRPPGNRAFAFIGRPVLAGPGGTAYATVGLVSEQVDRILVAPQGALGTYEVGTVGADAGLGGRFFVLDSSTNTPVVLTALSASGNQLGRANLSAARLPPA